ncbi:MAG TPA: ribosome small subunit-dependent GTPase A [Firmicutes bacterium]|nr:ribosome small subunit-dependent GTPase A [Bacillota bacterium]
MNGIIISGTRRSYVVYLEDKREVEATTRKTLVYQNGPLYIGDYVTLDQDGIIAEVKPRKNRLIRPKIANVSYGAIVCSTYQPSFSSYLLDKYLSYLLFCDVKPLILFTKMDMLDSSSLLKIKEYANYYSSLGFPTYLLSTKDQSSFSQLKKDIFGKITIFMGQTGAGKSSALNVIDPSFNRQIGEFSLALGRGKHKTKEVVLLPYAGGLIGDTPGFSALELPMNKNDLAHSFPGFDPHFLNCYYRNCLHIAENKCTIKERLAKGKISEESYNNYIKILEELNERK